MIRENENKYIGVLLLGMTFLASAGTWVKLSNVGPINLGFYRMLITLIILGPITWTSLKGVTRKQFLYSVIGGLFLGGDVLFWNLSLMYTSVADSALLVNLTVFIIPPLSYFLFKEEIKKKFMVGVFIGFLGVCIVIMASANGAGGKNMLLGDILAIMASVSYSGYFLFIYKVRDSVNNKAVVLMSTLGALIFLFASMIPIEGFQVPGNPREIIIVIMYALCAQILGQALISMCLGKLNASLVTAISLLGIGIAAIIAYFVFGEKIGGVEFVGMLVTVVGVFIAKQASQGQ